MPLTPAGEAFIRLQVAADEIFLRTHGVPVRARHG